jgi:tetratricopeptide (TPR) repeat protein/predicted Ser/Thr protein kinase
MARFSEPARIGRFEVQRRLGAGGMAVVYLANDPALGRTVALKVLPNATSELRQRFAREARSAARLTHPNIVTIFDIGEDGEQPFIAMEFVAGQTLAELVRRRAPLGVRRKLEIAFQLCTGLHYAHRFGIVHRDIKPGNVMIATDGVVKILDFGLAQITADDASIELTQPGTVLGTPHYMSPEQIEAGNVDARSDIFSVGLVIYELLAYQKAFPGDSIPAVMNRILNRDPIPLARLCPDIDPELERIVMTAVRRDPNQRFASLEPMISELADARDRSTDAELTTTAVLSDSDSPRSPVPDTPGADRSPRFASKLDEIARRRAAQIQQYLIEAELALTQGRFEGAVEKCELAAALDPSDSAMLALLERAHAGISARQIAELLHQAEESLGRDELSRAEALVQQALRIRPDAGEGATLHDRIADRRRQVELSRKVRSLSGRARTLLSEGRIEEAEGAVGEALRCDPADAEALGIERQVRLAKVDEQRRKEDADAAATIEHAYRLCESGDLDGALRVLQSHEPARHDIYAVLEDVLKQIERRDAASASRSAEADHLDLEGSPETRLVQTDWDRTRVVPLQAGETPRTEPSHLSRESGSPVRPRRWRRTLVAIGAVTAALLLAIGAWTALHTIRFEQGDGQTSSSGSVVESVYFNAVPWADVRIVDTSRPGSEPIQRTTPFAVDLAPGSYTAEFQNPRGGSVSRQVTVRPGRVGPVMVTMPGFDVDHVVDEVLAPQ